MDESRTLRLSGADLAAYAHYCGLDRVAPGRYSSLFAAQLFLHAEAGGVDPFVIVEEIAGLERCFSRFGTKPATQFIKEPLKGFYHKHFFSAHFLTQNIRNQLAGGQLEALVANAFGPESSVITEGMIKALARTLTGGHYRRKGGAGETHRGVDHIRKARRSELLPLHREPRRR